jgi:cytochrome c
MSPRNSRCLAGIVLLALATASPAGPPPAKLGEAVYARCAACHSLAQDRTGPRHCGLFGRRAGSVAGFDYSEAMKRSGIVWNARTLDRFLANPPKALPGTNMTYAGVPDRAERAALIAYLQQANGSAECRGQTLQGSDPGSSWFWFTGSDPG